MVTAISRRQNFLILLHDDSVGDREYKGSSAVNELSSLALRLSEIVREHFLASANTNCTNVLARICGRKPLVGPGSEDRIQEH